MLSGASLDILIRVIDLVGVLANAVLGGIVARRERLDPVGFITLAILSGLGGGIIRDVLIQHGTPVALTHYSYIVTAIVGAGIAYLLRIEGRLWSRVFPIADAIALGCWSVVGAQKALGVGLGWLPAILLGGITAVGGGTVRDVVLRRVPVIFSADSTLYATSAVLAGSVMVVFHNLGLPTIGILAGMLLGAGLTLVARWRGWTLPHSTAWRPRRFGGRGSFGGSQGYDDTHPDEPGDDQPPLPTDR